ncbi:MAG: hypothetical protein ACP5FZ_03675 [Fidelibacterota bacterium]
MDISFSFDNYSERLAVIGSHPATASSDEPLILMKATTVNNLSAVTRYTAVECKTTVQICGYDYTGYLKALNGIEYSIATRWDLHTGVDHNIHPHQKVTLLQNSPNPFNPVPTISYNLCEPPNVSLTTFNNNGHLVEKFVY